MSTCRILYLDAHRLTAFVWSAGRVAVEDVFESHSGDLTRLEAFLKSRSKSLFYLLANTPEESYQQEVIPYLRGGDRKALVTRKVGQYFFATPLALSISLGYERDRRKNERLLLSALTNPTYFDPWLTALQQADAALVGIYTPAQLGGNLLARLGHASERSLLLTVQDNSVRESFVVNGVTVFSRMAPLPDSSHAGIASALATEAGKLHQYLLGQRLVGRNEHLNAYVLAHPLASAAIKNSCIDSGGLSFVLLDSHAAAQSLGLKTPPQDSRADALFTHLLATRQPAQQYAPEELRHDYRLYQLRRGLLGLASITLLAGLLFAGKVSIANYSAAQQEEMLVEQAREKEQRYQALTSTFPKVEASNDELRQVTNRYTELQRQQGGPADFYRQLSGILDRAPNIELDNIEWKQEAAQEVATLTGNVKFGRNVPPRQTIAAFETFLQSLNTLPGVTASATQSPYDIESGRALRGSDRDEETLKQQPFTLKLQRKVQP